MNARGTFVQWWLVTVLAILAMLAAVDRLIIALLIDPIRRDLSLTDTEVSVLYGLSFALIYSLATIPAGWLADRWPRRPLVLVGALIWSLMTVACGLTFSYVPFFLARMGVGLSESVLGPAAQSLVRDGVDARRHGRGYAALALAGFTGAALSALLGGLLVQQAMAAGTLQWPVLGTVQPWQYTLLVTGACGVPLALLALTFREPARLRPTDAATSNGYREALQHVARHWRLYVPLLAYAVFHMMLSGAYAAWLPPLLGRKWHYAPAMIGTRLGVVLLIGPAIGLAIGGWLIDRLGRSPRLPWVGIAASTIIGIAGACGPLAASDDGFWACYGVLTLATGVPLPVIATIIAQRTPSTLMGKVVALQLTASGVLGTALAPTIVALLADGPFAAQPVPVAPALATAVALFAGLCVLLCLQVARAFGRRDRLDTSPPPVQRA